jgi:hypothetical protein
MAITQLMPRAGMIHALSGGHSPLFEKSGFLSQKNALPLRKRRKSSSS